MAPADERLIVQAEATYLLGGSSLRETIRSNPVESIVLPVPVLSLQGDARIASLPGMRPLVPYRVTNQGNVRLTLDLSARNASNCKDGTDTLDLSNLRFVVDLNGNGAIDPEETSTRLSLQPGHSASLLLTGDVPRISATGGACLELQASDSAQALVQTFRTFVGVGDAPVMQLTKTGQAAQSLRPGTADRGTYTVTAQNVGQREAVVSSRAPTGESITIDGLPVSVLLLRDTLPDKAIYQRGSLQVSHNNAYALYRTAGDAPYAYRLQEPASGVVEVAAAFPTNLAPGRELSLSFDVAAAAGTRAALANVAQMDYCPGTCASGAQSVSSNLASLPVEVNGLGLALQVTGRKINASTRTVDNQGVKTVTTAPDDTVTYTLALRVRNLGSTRLFNLQLPHPLAGSSLFGTYTPNEVPAPGQYTVVAGSLKVVQQLNSETAVTLASTFTGEGQHTGLLPAGINGSMLPPSGEFTLQYQLRVNASGRAGASIETQVRGQASNHKLSLNEDVVDLSTDDAHPDPDGDLDASNNSTPTRIRFEDADALRRLSAGLFITKEATGTVNVSSGVHDISYLIKVANNSDVDIPFVRIVDNLNCAFTAPGPLGQVARWSLIEGTLQAKNKVLPLSPDYTGDAPCDTSAHSADDPTSASPDPRVVLNRVQSLRAGQREEYSFTVRVWQDPSSPRTEVANKAWVLALQDNQLVDPSVLAAGASVTTLLVDPQGFVYDSLTRKPVVAARVSLWRASCETTAPGPITRDQLLNGDTYTYDEDKRTATMVTGTDGQYQFFWRVPPVNDVCTYTIRVEPPKGYQRSLLLPPEPGEYTGCGAVVPDNGIPQGDGAQASWYERVWSGYRKDRTVTINGTTVLQEDCPVLHNHIPLDPIDYASALLLSKKASRTQIELGDFIDYELKLGNGSGTTLGQLAIDDLLPPGFAYVPGSSSVAGQRVADPVVKAHAQTRRTSLSYELGARTLDFKGDLTLRYRLRVGVGAMPEADATNTAIASATPAEAPTLRIRSNAAQARVRVSGGVFSTRGFAVGKVWADCNRNGLQDDDSEPGIPGVRLYMEDGTSVITDAFGRWSLYGLKPITHALRVDLTTLPAGSTLGVIDNRQAGQAHSRFLDIKNGELARADFAVQGCNAPELLAQIEQRAKAFAQAADQQLQALVSARLPTDNRVLAAPLDTRGQPASGVAGGSTAAGLGAPTTQAPDQPMVKMPQGITRTPGQPGMDPGLTAPISQPVERRAPGSTSLSEALLGPIATLSSEPLEEVIENLPARAGFVELKNGSTVIASQINVRVTGPGHTTLRLLVNDQPVKDNRIGKRAVVNKTGLVAYEYIGVQLQPGSNLLEVRASDPFGNVRDSARIEITAPGALARVRLLPQGRLQADPMRAVQFKLQLSDDKGVPITARTAVTLDLQGAQWLTPDANPVEPGLQIMVEDGERLLDMQPPAQPGSVTVRSQASMLTHTETFTFLPALAPLQGIGLVEGVLDLGRQGRITLGQPSAANAFEQELSGMATQSGDHRLSGRTAFYFKGTIRGDYLLTSSFDSDKQARERLFRDIRPDEFYPVYGDGSMRGFDAQSSGKLYVRIDKNRSYLLLGDFNSASSAEVRQLSQYSRTLSGVQHRYQDDTRRITSFHAQTSATQQIEDLPANGLSFYNLANVSGDIRPGSEKVELQVRDRLQPNRVLRSRALVPMVDYSFEPLTRRLTLALPLATLDADLNPQFLRVTYELESGGPSYKVMGTDVQLKVTDQLQLGAVAVRDENPQNPRDLRAVTALARVGEATTVSAEAVHTQTELRGQGQAARVSVQHAQGNLRLQSQVQQVDKNFDTLSITPGVARTEANTIAEYAINADTRLRLQARLSREEASALSSGASAAAAGGLKPGTHNAFGVTLAHKLSPTLAAEVGLQQGNTSGGGAGGFTGMQSAGMSGAMSGMSGAAMGGGLGGVGGSAMSLPGVSTTATSSTSARARLTARPESLQGLQVFGEFMQDLDDKERRSTTVGADYALNPKVRVYAQHMASTAGGPAAGQSAPINGQTQTQATVLGVDSAYTDGGRIYNELRAPGQAAMQNASGVRHSFKLGEHWRLNAGAERVQALGSAPTSPTGATGATPGVATATASSSTAVTLGADWAKGPWRLSSAIEQRQAAMGNSSLYSLAGAWRLNNDLTLLARVISTATGSSNGAHNDQQRQQIGLAWRPAHADAWNILARYEHRKQDVSAGSTGSNPAATAPANTTLGLSEAHIASAHAHWRISRRQALSMRYAVKYSELSDTTASSSYWAQLAHARYTHDLTDTWDIGLQAGLMWGQGGTRQGTLGLETGYRLAPGLWLSVGHNVLGLREPDLAGLNHTSRGSYVRLRWKFDEAVLQFGRVAERSGPTYFAPPAAPRASATTTPSTPPTPEPTPAPASSPSAQRPEPQASAAPQAPAASTTAPSPGHTADLRPPASGPLPTPNQAPAAAEPVSGPSPERYDLLTPARVDDFEHLVERVHAWAAAWTDKNLSAYLLHYAPDFQPGLMSRAQWLAQRQRMLSRPGAIDVQVGPIEIRPQADGTVFTVFAQRYQSEQFRDQVTKMLRWKRIDAQWRIVQESNR